MTSSLGLVRFGPFEADLNAGELRKSGLKLRLTGQPFEILSILLERPGEVVTREELRQRLWREDTFVDYEHSLNAAVNKLRETLSDSAEGPVYIETLPRRGYRFIAPVQTASGTAPAASAAEPVLSPEVSREEKPQISTARRRVAVAAVGGATLAIIVIVAFGPWRHRAGARTGPPLRALAVLPFENLSRDPDQEYFADGITEALISRLSQIRSLHVISRTSVMQYRGAKQSLPEIARRLSVDAVVEGTVQRAGNRVAIFANLVEGSSDHSLWTGRYEGDLRDVLALQSQVAGAISDGVRAHVTAEEGRRVRWAREVDPEAYAAYLKGRYYQEKGVPWSTDRAIQEFQESLRRDPRFAPAWVRLAEAQLFSSPPRERMAQAKASVRRGLELNPSLPDGYVVLGLAQTFLDWDWAGAEKSFRHALELNPASSDAHYRYSHLLAALGRFDEAIAECRKALELDPLSPNVGHYLGRIYYFARRYQEAIDQFKRVLALDPNDYWSNLFLGIVYGSQGRADDAEPYIGRTAVLRGLPPQAIAAIQEEYRKSGYRAVLRRVLELSQARVPGPVSSSAQALGYAQLRDRERTLAWLEKAFDSHTRDLIYTNVEPVYDFIRGDPRFITLVKQLGLPR